MGDEFEDVIASIAIDHVARADACLTLLADAPSTDMAMPVWEELLTVWDYLAPDQRGAFKDRARKHLGDTEVGRRRLEYIEDLPG